MATMETEKMHDTITHAEGVDEISCHNSSGIEHVIGRDFTVAEEELPKGYFRSANFLGSMFAIGVSFGCGVAGFGLVAPVLALIDADIGPDPNISWVSLSYLLTNSVGLILVGRITDIFGRRWIFIGGNTISLIGSIVGATAHNVHTLIAAETLLGLGAAVQLSYAFVVGEIVPMKWRFLATGFVFAWAIPLSGLAPAIAYAFIFETKVGWRGIFYLLIALNALCTAAWYLFYHPPTFHMKHRTGRRTQFIKDFDYIGSFLMAMGLILFLMGLSWGGALYPWNSAHVIATVVLGFLTLVAFFVYEAFVPLKEPLLPTHLFRNRGWCISVILWAVGASIYYALAILWPSMVFTLYSSGHGHMWAGWMSCISNCGILFGEMIGAWNKKKTDWQIRIVFTLGAVFLAAAASCNPDTPIRAALLVFIAATFIGWNEILNSVVATICIDDQREIGTATGVAGSTRSFVSTICSTVYLVILSNRLKETIPAKVPSALINAGLPAASVPGFLAALVSGSADAFKSVQGLTPAITAIGARAYQEASSDAYKTVYLSTLGFSGICIILTWFAPNVDHLLSTDVTVTLHEKGTERVVGAHDGTKTVEDHV